MSLYVANIVLYVKYSDGNQNNYPIWENIVLIETSSEEEAFEKAEKIGKESNGDCFFWEDREAVWEYAGIRKLLEVDNINDLKNGVEITFSQMLLESKSDLNKFTAGDEVKVIYG